MLKCYKEYKTKINEKIWFTLGKFSPTKFSHISIPMTYITPNIRGIWTLYRVADLCNHLNLPVEIILWEENILTHPFFQNETSNLSLHKIKQNLRKICQNFGIDSLRITNFSEIMKTVDVSDLLLKINMVLRKQTPHSNIRYNFQYTMENISSTV